MIFIILLSFASINKIIYQGVIVVIMDMRIGQHESEAKPKISQS